MGVSGYSRLEGANAIQWLVMKRWLALGLVFFLVPCAFGMSEAEYRDEWVSRHGGSIEVVMRDGRSRCDIVTETHAIEVEVEFAAKWKDAIGQSLYYADQTGKRAGILLIVREDSDWKYVERLHAVITANKLPIDLW